MLKIFEKAKNKISSLFKSEKAVTDSNVAVEISTAKTKKKHIHFYERTPENDIKYRGPLSYRYVRLLGWIFQVFFVSGAVLSTKFISNVLGPSGPVVTNVFLYLGDLAVPSFLIANFAIILTSNQKTFKRMFLKYLLFLGMILILLFGFFYRYVLQVMNKTTGDIHAGINALNMLLNASPKIGFALNMFIDLILCLLVWFFLTYKPKKIKSKIGIVLFRLLVIIPILYELTCTLIKLTPLVYKDFTLPFYLFPFMTSKSPFTFIAFVIIAIFLKFRERIYEKKCGSMEKYDEFLTTNANSLSFSISTSIVFLVIAVIDIITLLLLAKYYSGINPDMPMIDVYKHLTKSGIGASSSLILFIPIVMLFSYTKKHKSNLFDSILPVVGIVLVALAVLETIIDALF